VVGGASIMYLWRRTDRWVHIARSSAEVGVVFTTLMLITGSIWGRPIWNTWWTWDPKLTTSLVLWLVYVGYLMVRSYILDPGQAARAAAVIGIVGTLDVPIIYKSAEWWRAIHPGPVITPGRANMPGEMVNVLLLSLTAFTLLYVFLMLVRIQVEQVRDEAALLMEPAWQGEA
ncbi:MAG: cytochrome c biogenesis protein CcsA, partial [Chloroflexi bacterium]|nr:cytochrome c biogenesis protein CcsA [Chloroflexota bacterium]